MKRVRPNGVTARRDGDVLCGRVVSGKADETQSPAIARRVDTGGMDSALMGYLDRLAGSVGTLRSGLPTTPSRSHLLSFSKCSAVSARLNDVMYGEGRSSEQRCPKDMSDYRYLSGAVHSAVVY